MITIVSTTNGVDVDFNSYFPARVNAKKGYWSRESITRVIHHGSYIEVKSLDDDWLLNLDGSDNLLAVGAVDAATPTDLDDLYSKLVAVIK